MAECVYAAKGDGFVREDSLLNATNGATLFTYKFEREWRLGIKFIIYHL